MDVKTMNLDGVWVVEIDGEINLSTSQDLKKSFEKLPMKKIVVDLGRVGYIDSPGLATLVEMLKKVKGQGGSLGLSGMSDKVRSLFEITKLDKLFQIYPGQKEAVSGVK